MATAVAYVLSTLSAYLTTAATSSPPSALRTTTVHASGLKPTNKPYLAMSALSAPRRHAACGTEKSPSCTFRIHMLTSLLPSFDLVFTT